MTLTPDQIESLCDYADALRAEQVSWEGVMERLRAADRRRELAGLTVGQLQGWHSASQKRKFREQAARERREGGDDQLEEMTNDKMGGSGDLETEDEAGPVRSFSEEAMELVKYFGQELVEAGEPRWQYAVTRKLGEGEYFTKHEGAGELGGVRWRKAAVVIWRGEVEGAPELVRVLPEHRVKRWIPKSPPRFCTSSLRLEVFTLANIAHVKTCEGLLRLEVRLKRSGLTEKERAALDRQRRRLELKLAFAGETAEVTVLRVQQIVSRLATVMDLHCPALTKVGSGAKLAAATGRTRAAQSAARLNLVAETAAVTGGRAGFEGLRAARKHAARGRAGK